MWPLNKCSYFNQVWDFSGSISTLNFYLTYGVTKNWNLISYWLHWWLKHLLGAITSLLFYHIKVSHLLHPIWKKFQDLVNWTETCGLERHSWFGKDTYGVLILEMWYYDAWEREKDAQDKGYMDFQESRWERGNHMYKV